MMKRVLALTAVLAVLGVPSLAVATTWYNKVDAVQQGRGQDRTSVTLALRGFWTRFSLVIPEGKSGSWNGALGGWANWFEVVVEYILVGNIQPSLEPGGPVFHGAQRWLTYGCEGEYAKSSKYDIVVEGDRLRCKKLD